MKSIKWLFVTSILALSVSSCFIDINDDPFDGSCLRGSGPILTEELDLGRIDAIDLKLPATVYLRQGAEQRVEIEAQSNVIDYIKRSVRGGLWEIESERCLRDVEPIRIYITVPEIVSVKISSSGKVISDGDLVVDDIDLGISGSGDIDLALEADDITASISGSGNLRLDGKADEMRFTISGSGDLKAFGLETRKCTVTISGSGDAEVYATEVLNVSISGSGDVFYHGRPSLSVSVSGSGDIIDAN